MLIKIYYKTQKPGNDSRKVGGCGWVTCDES